MLWLSYITSNVLLASLLALAAWYVQKWIRSPAIARVLWVLVLVKLVTPPILSLPLGATSNSTACALGTCACGPHSAIQGAILNTLPWILLSIWGAGAAVVSCSAWRRWRRFQRLLSHATPAPQPWQSLAAQLAVELSIRRPPELLMMPGKLPPLVVPGWRRPRLVLPTTLLDQLNTSQRAALLMHELVHIQRGDHLVRLLELLVRVAYWWLPIAGAIGRQLRVCEESCCDSAVVTQLPQARRDYARLLLDVVDFSQPLPRQTLPQATAMSVAGDLEQRLRAILDGSSPGRRGWLAGAFAIAAGCAILPCNLHYELAGHPVPAASVADAHPTTATPTPTGAIRPPDFSAFCCPG